MRRAIFISFAFLVVRLAGLKDFTTILNGTMGSVELGWGMSAFLGLLYVCAWLGFVVLAPILVLAAALLATWNRITEIRHSSRIDQIQNSSDGVTKCDRERTAAVLSRST